MENIQEYQNEIFTLIGKQLIVFQTIEMRLKGLLKFNNLILTPENQNTVSLFSKDNQTLGGLRTKVLQELFVTGQEHNRPSNNTENEDLSNELKISMDIRFNLCEHQFDQLSLEFQDFVQDRNFLIHHFQNRFNLNLFIECQNAIAYLKALSLKHQKFIDKIVNYCKTTAESMDDLKDLLESSLVKTVLIFPADDIYKALLSLLESNKNKDGWLSITTALQNITKNFPDCNAHIKQQYGFKNLSDLILNSGLYQLRTKQTSKGEKILFRLNDKEMTFVKKE